MPRKIWAFLFLAVFAVIAYSGAAPASARQEDGKGPADRTSHLKRATASFEKGFYEFLPKSQRAEAAAAFTEAVVEFKLALTADPLSRDAHRGLARVYYLQGDFPAAADQYRRLTELDPFDIDSYALAAVSLAESGRFADARDELEKAKARTSDPHALTTLDRFLAKLAEAEKQSGDGNRTVLSSPSKEERRRPAEKDSVPDSSRPSPNQPGPGAGR
jgi:tetratricopeptide (TPR) repeat protein